MDLTCGYQNMMARKHYSCVQFSAFAREHAPRFGSP